VYSIVDVDFGHHSNVITNEYGERRNTEYLSSLVQYDLHKRRPAIVISKSHQEVQIIPLSSKFNGCKALSKDSFSNLEYHYRKSDSHPIYDLIQSVSSYRVFPVRMRDTYYAEFGAKVPISPIDKIDIQHALAARFVPGIKQKNLDNERVIRKLREEKSRNLDKITSQKSDISQANDSLKDLSLLVVELGESLGLEGDTEHMIRQLKSQLLT
jgi:uncharacterized protein YifN (PemK superfamily)